MRSELRRLEVKKALRRMNNIHLKINAFEDFGDTDMCFQNQEISEITFISEKVYHVIYQSQINGQSMEGVEFVKNSSFFYGLKINSLELFKKEFFREEKIDSFGMEVTEFYTNWKPSFDEPCHYDMVLINGKFWTFAPNLSEIKEIAIMA